MTTEPSTATGIALGPLEGDARWFFGTLAVVKLRADSTDGRLSAVELVQPREAPVPPHVHGREDETLVVLEGDLAASIGDRQVAAGPGTILFVPRGVVHALEVTSQEPARFLMAWTPGGFENVFLTLGEPAGALEAPPPAPEPPPPEALEAAARVMRDHGTEVLGPPPQ